MNAPVPTTGHDPRTGEVLESGLPVGYSQGNQSLAVSIAMAEIDQQITTAHAFPRSVGRAVKNIQALATLDEETAKECIYALPRGGKAIRGPSIRLAEIIQSQWGNNRTGTRVVHVDRIEKYVEAEGVFHDLETNAASTARVRRRLTADRKTGLITDDMIMLTGNAAASIAKRNAILAGVPKAVWRKAYASVESVLIGDAKTMAEKRDDALKAFAAFGVKPEQIFEVLEIAGLEDIGPDQYMTLVGMHQALRNNEATVEEMFPAKKPAEQKTNDLKDRLDGLAGATGAAGAAEGQGDQKRAGAKPADEKKAEPAKTKPKETKNPETAADTGSGGGAEAPTSQGTPAATTSPSPGDPTPPAQPGGGDPAPADREAAIAKARADGASARKGGRVRKSLPAEYRKDEQLAEAWLAGFDTGEAERQPGEEG